ncbi:MAG: GNAT family N-acetyltransferase [Sphingobacteriaceae bacterium]
MEIIAVTTAAHAQSFLDMVQIIYQNDDVYVRPLDIEINNIFNPSTNNFHQHGEAARWILKDGDKIIGRVAAFINLKKAYTFEQPTGGMGFFECINDASAAKLLMDTARNWLQARGMEAMDGPINFGENDNFWGLLVQGFTHPAVGMNYNPEYYQSLFESYGFNLYFEQISNHMDAHKPLPERFAKIAEWVSKKPGYNFEHLKLSNLNKYSQDFQNIYNDAWQFHENFSPMSNQTVLESLEKMKAFIDERFIWFAYVDGNPAAFVITIPDVNQVIKYMNGKTNFFAKLKFAYYRMIGKMDRLRVVIMGVKPAYQKSGLESALIMKSIEMIRKTNQYKEIELSWVGDFNPKMRALHESVGAVLAKTHYTYRCLFSNTKNFKRATEIARDTKEKAVSDKPE